jgi:adenine-specific DNA-methyltransferase
MQSNPETNGRYHADWLNMMYPRLYLARNLLREDGVIFVSIDDHEVHSLRMLMNTMFGEENFLAQFIRHTRTGSNDALNGVSVDHEYVVGYAGSDAAVFTGVAKDFSKYANLDRDPRGDWMADKLTCNKTALERPNLYFPITDPITGVTYQCNPNRVWAYDRESMTKLIASGSVIFPSRSTGTPTLKRFRSNLRSEMSPFGSLLSSAINSHATKALRRLFQDEHVFDFPKGIDLVRAGCGVVVRSGRLGG